MSDASDMFDISGTMRMVSLCFVYGRKSIWIPWLWPVFNQVIMMMFLSKWAQAYSVNDIYFKYINPQASNRKVISVNYIVGKRLVTVGVVLGFSPKI
ncbi:MAG: hypothetical protein ABIN89_13145 [Chitinophagaceae bacterium]